MCVCTAIRNATTTDKEKRSFKALSEFIIIFFWANGTTHNPINAQYDARFDCLPRTIAHTRKLHMEPPAHT